MENIFQVSSEGSYINTDKFMEEVVKQIKYKHLCYTQKFVIEKLIPLASLIDVSGSTNKRLSVSFTKDKEIDPVLIAMYVVDNATGAYTSMSADNTYVVGIAIHSDRPEIKIGLGTLKDGKEEFHITGLCLFNRVDDKLLIDIADWLLYGKRPIWETFRPTN